MAIHGLDLFADAGRVLSFLGGVDLFVVTDGAGISNRMDSVLQLVARSPVASS